MRGNVKKKYKKNYKGFSTAQFVPDITKVSNGHRREHCSANRSRLNMIGINQGQQIRIVRPIAKGNSTLAVYTVSDVHDQEPNTVFVGYTKPEDLRDRLELMSTGPFRGKVKAQVTMNLTDAEAEDQSEFVEHLIDNGYNTKLIVIAPHGGNIEKHTDEQAERICEQLPDKYVSAWICKGFKQGGGAYDRWHITSTDINEESFPKLKSIIGRHFEYSVAFHGWDNDSICIGGGESTPPHLKQQVKEALVNAVSGSGICVETDEDRTCPGDFNGSNSGNIVNRLSTKGLQIEQSKKARARYGIKIADAVTDIFDPLIKA